MDGSLRCRLLDDLLRVDKFLLGQFTIIGGESFIEAAHRGSHSGFSSFVAICLLADDEDALLRRLNICQAVHLLYAVTESWYHGLPIDGKEKHIFLEKSRVQVKMKHISSSKAITDSFSLLAIRMSR